MKTGLAFLFFPFFFRIFIVLGFFDFHIVIFTIVEIRQTIGLLVTRYVMCVFKAFTNNYFKNRIMYFIIFRNNKNWFGSVVRYCRAPRQLYKHFQSPHFGHFCGLQRQRASLDSFSLINVMNKTHLLAQSATKNISDC